MAANVVKGANHIFVAPHDDDWRDAKLQRDIAPRLVDLIRGIPAKINLIPFNEWPGAPYKRSSGNRIHAFADIIHDAGYASPIRTPARRRHHGRLWTVEIGDRENA